MGEALGVPFQEIWSIPRLLELGILAWAWVILCARKKEKKRSLLHFVLLFAILAAVNTLDSALTGSAEMLGFFHILWAAGLGIVSFCYLLVFSGLRRRTLTLLWLVVFTAQQAIVVLSGEFCFLLDEWLGQGPGTDIFRICCYLVIPPLAWRLREYRFDEYAIVPRSAVMTGTVMAVSVLALRVVESIYFGSGGNAQTVTLLVANASILTLDLMAVHVIHTMCREQAELMQLQGEKQRFLSEREMTQMTEARLEDLRCIRHDLKNQYAYMQILLSEKRYDELERYFTKLSANLPEQLNMIDCGNRVMNTVLNMEFGKLRGSSIALEHQLVVPPVLPFEDDDICAIVANLMDNAAEECFRLLADGAGQAKLRLEIYPHQSYLYFKCMNSTDRTALKKRKGGLITTKADASLHGYGTKIVSRIAEKYNGAADYSLSEGQFIAQVMLDMTKNTEEKSNENQNRAV
ncbi:MAG: sensor histidine kinase [Clostridia bacterium]|nr:sensor histidine kinase [Clostridia bacterium]